MNYSPEDFPALGAPPPTKKAWTGPSATVQDETAAQKADKRQPLPNEDFPALGPCAVRRLKREHDSDKWPKQIVSVPDKVPDSDQEPLVKKPGECFVCGQTGGMDLVGWGEWSSCGFLHGKGVCRECLKKTPRSFIMGGYLKRGQTVCSTHINALCSWITLRADIWPSQYPDDVRLADWRNERWESLHYYSVWKKEKRFKGEGIAWFSTRQQKMVVGEIQELKDDGTCIVYRDAETEKEKELGECFRKTINQMRLMPPLSQKASLELIRKTPGFTRPRSQAPFKCDGPCGRVRISSQPLCARSGPLKSNQNGCSYCKECYQECNIEERDNNLWQAREYYSDREHRGFGGCMVHTGEVDSNGTETMKYRSCSCSSCDNRHRGFTCEGCGCKGGEGWFDRWSHSLTGPNALPTSSAWSALGGWNQDDRWCCKKCWMDRFWKPGSWEWLSEDSLKFNSN